MPEDQPESYFVGRPRSEVEISVGARPRYNWKSILGLIQPGMAQEVRIKSDTCKAAIERLEKADEIPTGEYYVKSRSSGGKRSVYIIRRAKADV